MDMWMKPGQLSGSVAAPASKSEAHRRMICAGLSGETTVLTGFMESDDMRATANCLRALGADLKREGDCLRVTGKAHPIHGLPLMDCGESGSTLRFFVPIAMALAGGGVFRMHGRLGQRPMDVYRDLFVPRGTRWNMGIGADGAAELHVVGTLKPGDYELPGNVSSQFVSGLLFALPLLEGESTLTVVPPVESIGYIRMTLQALQAAGIQLENKAEYTWRIPGGQTYHGESGALAGDWSQAAVFLCAGALGHPVTVTGLTTETTQGDAAVLDMLRSLGAGVKVSENGITVTGPTKGAELDVRNCPDIAPMLALVCALSSGSSVIRGCGRLRLKECDRLEATASLLNGLGARVDVRGDEMHITGVERLQGGAEADTCRDHRMVMLASVAALHCAEPVLVKDVQSLDKSWPEYLSVYKMLGGQAE